MLRRRPRATLNDTPFPYTMLFLSRDQCAFHFGGADAVAGDVDHVINAPGDPVIAVSVAAAAIAGEIHARVGARSEEHTSELQSLMRNSYAVFCLKKKKIKTTTNILLNNNTETHKPNDNLQHT